MAIFRDIINLPDFRNAVITVGTFDGVHKGHEAILNEVARHAAQAEGESVLLTFDPHPRKLLFPDEPLGIITPLQQKLELIMEAGIRHIVVVPFTHAFAGMGAEDYIKKFLVGHFHPHTIIIGHDHHFGHDRKGNIKLLEEYAQECQYELIEIPAQLIDEAAVSSTKIRRAIQEGRMEDATHMLGRAYSISGTVVHGNKLGRTLGYPTANIVPADKEQIMPAHGIYAILAKHQDAIYEGMLSIGYNPTISDKRELRTEANLFGFDKEIYGDTLEVFFVHKLRDEQKFASLEALTTQLHRDKENALHALCRARSG